MSDVNDEEQKIEESAEAGAPPGENPAEARIATLEAELAKAKDDHLRALAEVENVRRRGEKQAADARTYAIDRFAGDLLAVADTLARALDAVPEDQRSALDDAMRNLVEGVAMTERTMLDAFGRHGLKRVGAKGEKFDPNLHQAVAQIPSSEPANHIAEVMQPGFKLGERTLRAAIVAVSLGQGSAQAPSSPPPASDGAGNVDIKV